MWVGGNSQVRLDAPLAFAAWLTVLVVAQARASELTVLQADSLARLAFEHQVKHIKKRGGYSLDPYPPEFDSRYFHFQVLDVCGNPNEAGSAVLGGFAVNRLTAEVWDTYAECFRVNFPALRKMQNDYRRRYRLPARNIIPPDP